MQLSDLFAPLNLFNLPIFLACLIVFDSVGFTLALFLKLPDFLRVINWVIGASIFVFGWFLLHFFIPFNSIVIVISLFIFFLSTCYWYFAYRGPSTLFWTFIKYPYPLILLVLAAKRLFFLISIPPYLWDEMAYHYYSPSKLAIENVWSFLNNVDLYYMVPKTMETASWLLFEITKTYATARLLHFLIFFSGVYTISLFLKKYLSYPASIIYSTLALFLSINILIDSTSGYVDVAAAILVNVFFICLLGLIITLKKEFLYATVIFLGLSIGIKYTVVVFVGSVIAVSPILFAINYFPGNSILLINIKKLFLLKKHIMIALISFLLMMVTGGYWYIKNIIATGNPIVPLIFKCINNLPCGTNNELFSGWTIPLDVAHLPELSAALFQQNTFLRIVLITVFVGIIASYIYKKSVIKLIIIAVLMSVSVEFFVSGKVAGFIPRYYYHWYLLIPLLLSTPYYFKGKLDSLFFAFNTVILSILMVFLFSSAGISIVHNLININSDYYMSNELVVRQYAKGKLSINGWVKYQFPQMNAVIQWCGQKHPMTDIFFSDPKLIWNDYEGLMRVYLVNCQYRNLPYNKFYATDDYLNLIKSNKNPSYYISLERCLPDSPPSYIKAGEIEQYTLNQQLVCKGKEVLPNLYALP